MARFYCDIQDGKNHFQDEVGSELPDQEAAGIEALETIAQLTRGRTSNADRRDITANVRSEAGVLIFTATQSIVGRWTEQPVSTGPILHEAIRRKLVL